MGREGEGEGWGGEGGEYSNVLGGVWVVFQIQRFLIILFPSNSDCFL